MKIVNIKPRTPQWHRWRDLGVSASEADIVLGRSSYKTPYRLYAEKKGLMLPDNLDGNPHVRRGIRLEPVARHSFETRYSDLVPDLSDDLKDDSYDPVARSSYESRHDVLLFPLCAEADEYPFIRASFDGVDDNGIPVEIKAPSEKNFRDAQTNGEKSILYQRYYPQVQQQILVAGSTHAWLTVYLNETEYLDFLIQRDEVLINEIISKASEFVDCLNGKRKPPEMNPERDIFIPGETELDEWNVLAIEYHAVMQAIKQLEIQLEPFEQAKANCEKKFIHLMGDFTQGESAGVRVNRYMRLGSVDFKAAFKALCPDMTLDAFEPFRKASTEALRCTIKSEEKATVPFSMEKLTELTVEDSFWF